MSVCMSLYAVVPNVECVGQNLNADFLKDIYVWSDNCQHDFLDLTYHKALFNGNKGWKRLQKRLEKFNIKRFDDKRGYISKYLTVNPVKYAQGWFFKKRYFKKKNWVFFGTTKKEMDDFFKRYVKVTEESEKIMEDFLNAWKDGMIFECSF